jgi:tetratricopeptide (TPR) repeat protein
MKLAVTVRATAPLRRAYRELLAGEWDESTLPRALDLLELLLATGGVALAPVASGVRRAQKPFPLPPDASAILRDFMECLSDGVLPPLPPGGEPPGKPSELAQVAERTRLLLNVQMFFAFQGDVGLLRDTQSLAFHAVLDVLLPRLRAEKLDDERALTMNALGAHLALEWQDDPAHRAVLQAALLEHVGAADAAGRHLEHAFRSTPPDAREYLSLAQAYWFSMIDRGQHVEAEAFLLDLYRNAPSEALPEVREMMANVRRQPISSQ